MQSHAETAAETTLWDLIATVDEFAESADEAAAVVEHMLCTGQVRLRHRRSAG